MIYFTSDEHDLHKNIIQYCNRPYNDVYTMRADLIAKHNSVVMQQDEVYHLGDMSWGKNEEDIIDYLGQLKGTHHLIVGNHDYKQILQCSFWKSIQDYKELWINHDGNKYNLILFHYPLESWNKQQWGSIHLHGHTHEVLRRKIKNRLEVGIDCVWTKGYPVNIKHIIEEITLRETKDGRNDGTN